MTEKIDPMAGTANDYEDGIKAASKRVKDYRYDIEQYPVLVSACWQCNGTGFFGGVDNDHIKCTHPPDTRVYNDESALLHDYEPVTPEPCKLEAALREITNLPACELGRAYKISREALGIKVEDEA